MAKMISSISDDREAELLFRGVTRDWAYASRPLLIVDVRGGSTEWVVGESAFMEEFNFSELFVSEHGLRDGTIRVLVNRAAARESKSSVVVARSVRTNAYRTGRVLTEGLNLRRPATPSTLQNRL
jgi:exopolyphosphatase/pppGpp-phosphohydrolase